MTNIEILEQKVRHLYETKNPNRGDWADWLYDNRIFIVADNAEKLANRFNAPVNLCRAAAVLHDIADVEMSRFDENHESTSLEIARKLLTESGFSDDDIIVVVDDAIVLHSCHDGKRPQTLTGQVLATADAMAHINTNFYEYTTKNLLGRLDEGGKKKWALKKLPRDFLTR